MNVRPGGRVLAGRGCVQILNQAQDDMQNDANVTDCSRKEASGSRCNTPLREKLRDQNLPLSKGRSSFRVEQAPALRI